ncbi:hypothetical protein VPH35_058344 [Triticum aestivum]
MVIFSTQNYTTQMTTPILDAKHGEHYARLMHLSRDMVITFDIRPEGDIEGNTDIWVDVQTPSVIPLSYFRSSKHVQRLVDRTSYCPGAELNCEELSHYVSWLEDLDTVKTNFLPALRNVSTENVRPIVFVLNYVHIFLGKMGLPMNVVPHGIETKGTISIVSLRPRYPTMHFSTFRISNSEEVLIVKDWTKFVMEEHREVLGGSNQKRSPRIGDRFICMLQLDEGGELHMFYVILPEREQ